MRTYLVQDWMSINPIYAAPSITLTDAHNLMKTANIRHLPIVKNGKLISLVTINQIRRAELETAAMHRQSSPDSIDRKPHTVAEIMTPDPMNILPDSNIIDATHLILKNKLSGLPVVDRNGRLVGIITESDIFHLLIEQKIPDINES